MMKTFHNSLFVFVCFLCGSAFSQQVIIEDTFTPQQLVEDNLIQGCVETSNISSQVNGSVNGFASFGYFERGASDFPFENGIVLSTGRAISGGNVLNTLILNEGEDDWLTDPDLEATLGITNTLNATSIEFDFVSISNLIQFNYILASEEYFANFPCDYSDGFALLIKEAGTSDPYTNIAVIPGTSTPVNTNTIHQEIVGFCPASNPEYFDGYNFPDTNFNGRTTIMSATANIIPNVTYHIKLIIADQTDENYDSAVFIQGNSFNASVDLGPDTTTCAESIILDGNIENPLATYTWFLNDAPIDGETDPTLTVTQSGSYTVEVAIPLSGSNCILEDTVEINLSSTQIPTQIDNFELCDDPSLDGIELFDLSTLNDEVLASVPASNYNISYHYSSANAENNVNPILVPILNTVNNQIIHIRIEDTVNGCLAYSSFQLVVNPPPSITTPTILFVCDDPELEGFTEIDLTEKDDEITGGQPNLLVSYHYSQADADAGINAIPQPYVNVSLTDQVFVRVVDSLTGCFSTTTMSVSVLNNPVINYEDLYIDACDPELDGFATFDLTSITSDVLQGLTGVTVTFHLTYEDAQSGSNPIPNPASFDNTAFEEQTIYIRVEDDSTGCSSITDVEIHPNLLLTATNIRDFSECDDGSDNTQSFNLDMIAESIINDLEDVSVIFYASEEDQQNQVNALDPNIPFIPTSFPTLLYITINSLTCSEISEIELLLDPVTTFPPVDPVTYCDDDQDGFTNIDLQSFDNLVTGGQDGYVVTYFESESDAEANINPLPPFYTNTSNPQTIYPRIALEATGCADINSFEITVIPAPITTQPNDILVCDNDQDGFSVVDLTQVYSQLVTDTTDREFKFYGSEEDYLNDTDAFTNVSNYSANTQLVYVKTINTTTGCDSMETFNIYVNTLPNFTEISDYDICELSTDGIGDFIFETQDEDILNGQPDKQVLYFLNQSDADNRINAIDKNSPYQNISNPQTIYVRVENLTDQDCYGTSTMTIEVGTDPQYNQPSNWFECDDLSNDAIEIFDLNLKIAEITQGMSDNLDVSFYTSQANADNASNPLPLQFANTVNPQQIYVRIDNGTICAALTSFTLNVVQVAQANPAQPIEVCDTDYDGSVTFDLTISELDILDVRQDNIIVSYYETLAELETETNPILNPEAYDNITNPQTVYVRLTNTISNCFLALPLELIVNLPPAINDFVSVTICDNEASFYDLTEVNNLIVDDTSNTTITYHNTAADALADENPVDTNYTYTANSTTFHIRIEDATTACFATYGFELIVQPIPIANAPNDLEDCDDDFDGLLTYDLSTQNATVLGGQNPANFSVTYYNSLTDAESGSNALPELYAASNNEIIYVRVEHTATGCFDTTQFFVTIHPRPVVDIPDQVLCVDNLPLTVSANTNNLGDAYIWSTGATTPEIDILTVGTYSVTVTTLLGCETTQVFEVTASESATIELVETIDFSDPNNITITIDGIGNYMYQLDDEEPQESNVFENVGIGYHIVTIIDLNGCLEITKEVLVLDFPKFMTPNDDGYFDTWHIIGVEHLPGTVIYIYDRFGKQIHFLTSYSRGWDGTYNGYNMPATDYWFVADVKRGDISFQAKGHFALRR